MQKMSVVVQDVSSQAAALRPGLKERGAKYSPALRKLHSVTQRVQLESQYGTRAQEAFAV